MYFYQVSYWQQYQLSLYLFFVKQKSIILRKNTLLEKIYLSYKSEIVPPFPKFMRQTLHDPPCSLTWRVFTSRNILYINSTYKIYVDCKISFSVAGKRTLVIKKKRLAILMLMWSLHAWQHTLHSYQIVGLPSPPVHIRSVLSSQALHRGR